MNPKHFITLKYPDFQRCAIPLKLIILIKTPNKVKACIAPFITLLFAPSKPKLVDFKVHNQCLNFLWNWDFSQFWSKMLQFSISQEGWFCGEKSTNFCFKDIKRSVMNGAKTLFDSWYLNNCFLRSSGPLKIRLLQCYVVLWIHNIDAICTLGLSIQWFRDSM